MEAANAKREAAIKSVTEDRDKAIKLANDDKAAKIETAKVH